MLVLLRILDLPRCYLVILLGTCWALWCVTRNAVLGEKPGAPAAPSREV